MAGLTHVSALYRKDFIISRRNWKFTVFSLILPWALMLLLWWVKAKLKVSVYVPFDIWMDQMYTVGYSSEINQTDIYGLPNSLVLFKSFYQEGNAIGIINGTGAVELNNLMVGKLEELGIEYMCFPSEKEFLIYAQFPTKKKNNITQNLTSGFTFINDNDNEIRYKIFVDKLNIMDVSPNYISQMLSVPQFSPMQSIAQKGVLVLQTIADTLILKNVSNNKNARINYIYSPFEQEKSKFNPGDILQKFLIPFIFVASGLCLYGSLQMRFLDDKISRMRETMTMMGLRNSSYIFASFLYYLTECTITCIVSTIILRFCVFQTVDSIILFIFLLLFYLTFFPYAVGITSIFSTKVSAILTGIFVFYIGFELCTSLSIDYLSTSVTKQFFALHPAISIVYGLSVLSQASLNESPVTFSSISTLDNYGFTITLSIIYLIIDIIWLFLVAIYLDNVLPNLAGISKSPLFFLTKSFWLGSTNAQDTSLEKPTIEEIKENINADFHEEVSENLKNQQNHSLSIRNLTKTFPGNIIAVDHLSVDMYENQIFALLGHNGAGKTTTISVLCGMLSPDNGNVHLQGKSLLDNMDELQNKIGLCPQFDVLFGDLTVMENIKIFGTFKGLSNAEIDQQSNQLIKDLMLQDKKDSYAFNLSGGHKRKLSILIALLGNPLLVMLDEPTSGLDTSCRHELWEILKNAKKDRIMVLTTHYMDEADILGDRIGIMTEGKLACLGSSLFLKSKFGIGYNLILSKKKSEFSQPVIESIQKFIPEAKDIINNDTENVINLPFSSASKFKSLFEYLDNSKEEVGISSYGLTMTTLEDVFLKINDNVQDIKRESLKNFKINMEKKEYNEFSLIEGSDSHFLTLMYASLYKRALEFIRSPLYLLFVILTPLVISIIAFTEMSAQFGNKTHFYSDTDLPLVQRPVVNEFNLTNGSIKDLISNLDSDYKADIIEFKSNLTGLKLFNAFLRNQTIESSKIALNNPLLPFRYGGFSILENNNDIYTALILYNSTASQSSVHFCNILFNLVIKSVYKLAKKIVTGIQQALIYEGINQLAMASMNNMPEGSVMTIAFCFAPAFICSYLIKEKKDEVKFQQQLSGLSLLPYWAGNFVVDIILIYISFLLTFITMAVYDEYVDPHLKIFLLLFNPAILLFAYFTTFLLKSENYGFLFHLLVNGFVFTMLPFIPITIAIVNAELNYAYYISYIIVCIFPSSAFCLGLYNIGLTQLYKYLNPEKIYNPLDFDIAGLALIMLGVDIVLYALLIFICEKIEAYQKIHIENQQNVESKSENLLSNEASEEEERIRNNMQGNLVVKLKNLSKNYDNLKAVNNISFGVEYGEVMGLLGVNGSGKTTTFKMITNHIQMTGGEIMLMGKNIFSNEFQNKWKLVGYCPQINPLFETLTVYEHLKFYSMIKGIPSELIENIVNETMKNLELLYYKDIISRNLSGGNKRKLSVAIALIGNPPLLMLDEPSTGIDPKARRQMWNMIKHVSMSKKMSGVILSTHSMEEAENLSSKIVILSKGKIVTIGSPQFIKEKFGTDFIVEIKIISLNDEEINTFLNSKDLLNKEKCEKHELATVMEKMGAENLMQNISLFGVGRFIELQFQDSGSALMKDLAKFVTSELCFTLVMNELTRIFEKVSCIEHELNYIKLKIEKGKWNIGEVFGIIEENKINWKIKEYSVIPTSLEEIFQMIAKKEEYSP